MGRIMMLQNKLQKFFGNKITVWRKVLAPDDYSGYTKSWVKNAEAIPCRISEYSGGGDYKINIEGEERLVTHIITCDKDTDLVLGDKIIDDNFQGKYILLKIVRVRRFKDIHHLKCYLTLTEGEDMV